jgi:hypothetical protein
MIGLHENTFTLLVTRDVCHDTVHSNFNHRYIYICFMNLVGIYISMYRKFTIGQVLHILFDIIKCCDAMPQNNPWNVSIFHLTV